MHHKQIYPYTVVRWNDFSLNSVVQHRDHCVISFVVRLMALVKTADVRESVVAVLNPEQVTLETGDKLKLSWLPQ